jgi:hypothetical protein
MDRFIMTVTAKPFSHSRLTRLDGIPGRQCRPARRRKVTEAIIKGQ